MSAVGAGHVAFLDVMPVLRSRRGPIVKVGDRHGGPSGVDEVQAMTARGHHTGRQQRQESDGQDGAAHIDGRH